jgi:hypothetical protein
MGLEAILSRLTKSIVTTLKYKTELISETLNSPSSLLARYFGMAIDKPKLVNSIRKAMITKSNVYVPNSSIVVWRTAIIVLIAPNIIEENRANPIARVPEKNCEMIDLLGGI